jgi:isopentenyldiphosphate isomerase
VINNTLKSTNYFARRKSRYYYRSWRKAVASHSTPGMYNYNAMSRYVTNEIRMSSENRKSSVLPCGYTIAESWAALRKSWLAFNIAKSNNDFDRMSKYAGIIRKVQREMGIQETSFDTDILDDQAPDDYFYKKDMPNDLEIEESSIDYEGILGEARAELYRQEEPKADPRDEIFDAYKPGEKSCEYIRSTKEQEGEEEEDQDSQPEVETWIRHRNACEYVCSTEGQEQEKEEVLGIDPEIETWTTDRNRCEYVRSTEGQEQEKEEVLGIDQVIETWITDRNGCEYVRSTEEQEEEMSDNGIEKERHINRKSSSYEINGENLEENP